MTAFYFDVGGVLVPDRLAPERALSVFRDLARRHGFDAAKAHATYVAVQPSLDLGVSSLTDLCAALRIDQHLFEQDWLTLHPIESAVIDTIDRLLTDEHAVGLATNFCRRLLDLLIERTPTLSRLSVCCSSDIGVTKPSTEFFQRARDIIDSHDVVFVDDRLVNVEAARRFGWTAVHATAGWRDRFEERYLPCQHQSAEAT